MPLIDLTGQHFGRWLVESMAPDRKGHAYWNCLCECGTRRAVAHHSLGRDSKSCGCWQRDHPANLRHNRSRSHEYMIWAAARARCIYPSVNSYPRYGGRGIKMCDAWSRSFTAFFTDMGSCPTGHQLDRIDNDGNYEPGNCRWVPRLVQANNKSNNVRYTFNGEKRTATEWARHLSVPYESLRVCLAHLPPELVIPNFRADTPTP